MNVRTDWSPQPAVDRLAEDPGPVDERSLPESQSVATQGRLIFGDASQNHGSGFLIAASRVIVVIARAQGTLAMPTRIGDQINSHVHALGWDQRSRVAGMSRLSTGLPSTLRAARARWRPARPSEDGGFDVVVEFC
jgi:hypothetical protein